MKLPIEEHLSRTAGIIQVRDQTGLGEVILKYLAEIIEDELGPEYVNKQDDHISFSFASDPRPQKDWMSSGVDQQGWWIQDEHGKRTVLFRWSQLLMASGTRFRNRLNQWLSEP